MRLTLPYSAAEYADIRDAAQAAGVTATSYAADAAIATARGRAGDVNGMDRQVMLELLATRAQLRRYGNNLNQAARILNAGGDPPEWLRNAIALTDRVVQRVDRAVQGRSTRPTGGHSDPADAPSRACLAVAVAGTPPAALTVRCPCVDGLWGGDPRTQVSPTGLVQSASLARAVIRAATVVQLASCHALAARTWSGVLPVQAWKAR